MLIIQCDFDDTITVGNVSTIIRDAFGPEELLRMEDEYVGGKYSVEESNIRQFALIKASKEEITDLVREKVVVREGFGEFVEYCRAETIPLVVVSSGLDLYIDPVMQRQGLGDVEYHSAKAEVTPSGVRVGYTDPLGAPLTSGFKDAYVLHHKRAGATVVYIGDGLSDIGPAHHADYVMARSTLAERLRAEGMAFRPFATFHDVRDHVDDIRRRLADGAIG